MNFNQYFKSRQGEMINLLKDLVQRESPTSDKKAVDACSLYLIEQFKKIGVKTRKFPQKEVGDFHLVEYPAKEDKSLEGQILVLTHIDTVWPVGKIKKMPFYVSGEKVLGPGVLDMKAGLVLSYFALKTLNELNIRPQKKIAIFINSAEETGNDEAHDIIRKLAKKADSVLCLEPALPGGGLKVQRKGRLVIRLDAFGKSAHGGTPEKGVNAVEELIAQLRRVQTLKSKDISVNIGLIGGGEKANVVPDKAWAICDVRFWNTVQKDKIIGFFKKLVPRLRGARIKFSVESLTPPMEKTRASTDLFLEAKKIAADLGIALEGGKTGGGSDASIAAGVGVATLDGLGPDGDGIHANHEHLILPSLIQRAALLVELLRQL
ncbi:MAG: M20 family metallopeptidase [Candidatus Aminicenantes bacterium]|nr:M20 family metallopeptidase [Candidatus Aminicenantes bacterium]